MTKFNPFRLPKANRVLGSVRSVPLWLRCVIKPDTKPEDWAVIKLSGNRVGYVKTHDLRFA